MKIYETLRKDQNQIASLLSQLVQLNEGKKEERGRLISLLCENLVPYCRAEAAVFYHALSEARGQLKGDFLGLRAHQEIERDLRILQLHDKTNADWRATAIELQVVFAKHVRADRIWLEAGPRYFSAPQAESLGEEFEAAKRKIRGQDFFENTVEMVKNLMGTHEEAESADPLASLMRRFSRGRV